MTTCYNLHIKFLTGGNVKYVFQAKFGDLLFLLVYYYFYYYYYYNIIIIIVIIIIMFTVT